MIEVRRCPEGLSTSAKSILNEQRDMGNEDLEVLISDVVDEDRLFSSSVIASQPLQPSPRVPSHNRWSSYNSWVGKILYNAPKVKWMNFKFNRKVTSVTHDAQDPFELDKKSFAERSVVCVSKRHVPSKKRTNLILKRNCQPRQAIMSRHSKEELKRD